MQSRRRWRAAGLAVGVALTVAALPLPVQAQRVQSNVVLVRADDVITEDLYAAGNTVIVSGTIQGDLVAIAFDSIRIDGVVEGDVIAISTSVEITGRVEGAVRVISGSLSLDGAVEEDLFAGTLTLQAAPGSNVGRDILAWARTVELLGEVGRNVEGTHTRTRIAGTISGDVDVTTGGLALLPGANIVGDLRYTSDDAAVVAGTAEVGGTFVRAEALAPNLRVRGIRLLVQLVGMISALGIGIGILWAAPNRSLAAAGALVRAPLRSLAWGVGVASVPLALGIVTFAIVSITSLSSSGPVVLVLLPIALALAAIVFMALLTTPVPLALAAGNRLRPAWSSYARYVAGFPLIVIVWLLPWVGGIVIGVLALAGLGSWLVADDPT